MFKNIGNKIKGLAVFFTVIGIIASCILGFLTLMIVRNSSGLLLTILIIVVGCLLSWVSSFLLYGFGELVDKTSETAETNRQLLGIIAHQNGIDLAAESDDTWKCEYCGRTNSKYASTCAWGASRDEQIDKEQEVSEEYTPLPKQYSEMLYALNDLKMKNLISQEEYNSKVQKILNRNNNEKE